MKYMQRSGHELEKFDPELIQKVEIIILTKTDIADPESRKLSKKTSSIEKNKKQLFFQFLFSMTLYKKSQR
jgi:GTPase involved in cell partitioning and DNA repair